MYFPFPASIILCFPRSSTWNLKGKFFCRVGWTLDFGQIPRNSHQHIGPRLLIWHTHWLRGSRASSGQAQGRNLENGAKAETAEELCLLTCFSWFTQAAFLYSSGPPAQGQHFAQWAGSSHINRIKKMPFRHMSASKSYGCDSS